MRYCGLGDVERLADLPVQNGFVSCMKYRQVVQADRDQIILSFFQIFRFAFDGCQPGIV